MSRPVFEVRWTVPQWRELLNESQPRKELADIRHATRRALPLGSESFLQSLEQTWNRKLIPNSPGRPKKAPGREASHSELDTANSLQRAASW